MNHLKFYRISRIWKLTSPEYFGIASVVSCVGPKIFGTSIQRVNLQTWQMRGGQCLEFSRLLWVNLPSKFWNLHILLKENKYGLTQGYMHSFTWTHRTLFYRRGLWWVQADSCIYPCISPYQNSIGTCTSVSTIWTQ